MVASLLWKEYREHRAVWLALAVVAAGALLGVPAVFPPEAGQARLYNESLTVLAVLLAWTYGIVCGAMLLAGERESGTQSFLDLMPAFRFRIWLVKLIAGLVLLLAQLAVLAGCVVLGQFVAPHELHWAFLGLFFAGLVGLGWGLVFSARAASVLAAIGQAIAAQFVMPTVILVVFAAPVLIIMAIAGVSFSNEPPATPLVALVMLVLPWPVSARLYSQQDRERQTARPARQGLLANWRREWGAAWWLARSRSLGFALGLALFCFAAGFPLVASGLIFWPLLTLIVGVVCGATVFLDEQSGPYRFLGDQRFPLARLWLLKAAVRGFLGLCSLALLLLPSFVVMLVELGQRPMNNHDRESVFGRLFGSGLIGTTIPVGLFLFTPFLYGFALGHLCGLVFRKPIVALVAGFGLGVMLLSVWAPSFATGGLNAWQVLSVPAALLVAVHLLLRPWASDRLASWDSLSVLGGTAVVSVALVAAGLWYRVAEIPDEGEPPGLAGFLARIPSIEENEAGRAVRSALAQLETRRREWEVKRPAKPLFPGEVLPADGGHFLAQCHEVIAKGWPSGKIADHELAARLDEVFSDDYWQLLDEASRKPVGMFDDPRRRTVDTPTREFQAFGMIGSVLAARGLEMQMKGEPGVFVDNLERALTIVRNLQNGGMDMLVFGAVHLESEQLVALDRWLEAIDGRPDLLRRAGAVLDKHRAWLPPTYDDNDLAGYLIGLNSLDQPQEWIRVFFPAREKRGLDISEAELLTSALRAAPWERERQQRVWRIAHNLGLRLFSQRFAPDSMPSVIPLGFVQAGRLRPGHARRVVRLDAARLKVALRHHQAATGRPAERIDELIPGSIAAIPADPFDSRPFRYRLSTGEEIEWPKDLDPNAGPVAGGAAPGDAPPGAGVPGEFAPAPPAPVRKIPPGQGILWSVGEDHQDDGGRRQGLHPDNGKPTELGEDLIYLVPLPPKKARE